MKYVLIVLVLFSSPLYAGTKDYVVGEGSEFKFTTDKGQNIGLSIYIVESSFTKLGIEYFFSAGGLLGVETWQQYLLGISGPQLTLEEGYIQSNEMKKAEIMTKEFRENNENGVKVEDFFFTKESEIEKYKIGLESIEVPAGTILTNHYQKKRSDQIVDFWISDKAGAIGLVKLVSTGAKNKDHNYKIELLSLLKNVKAKINRQEAIPLTEKGKFFLHKK